MRNTVPRVVTIEGEGRLMVATDVQGHVRDFQRIAEVFEEMLVRAPGSHLVVTGDLVHGPELEEEMWPEYLGSYYLGDSTNVLAHAQALQEHHPGQVHYLLGNHEHAHVGGPVVSKFFPDEAARLESLMGDKRAQEVRAWLETWPFVAVVPKTGLLMLHAAPHAAIQSADDLERLNLRGFFDVPLDEVALHSTLGALLWARTTSTERAKAFLAAISPDARVAVFGHDVAREGHAIDREPLLCVSTSFGCYDGDKVYLDWDLSEPATTAYDTAKRGLKPLYPNREPVYRHDI